MEDAGFLDKLGGGGRALRRGVGLVLVLAVLAAEGGCTRRFYRLRADREVADVLAGKDHDPRWKVEAFHVYPDPRARFADPANPDRPPMPPDDPAAKALSPNPQRPGKAGVGVFEGDAYLKYLAAWDAENRGAAPKDAPPGPEAAEELAEPRHGGKPFIARLGRPKGLTT